MGTRTVLDRGCFVMFMGKLCVARIIDPSDFSQPRGAMAKSAADALMRATGPLSMLDAAHAAGPIISPAMAVACRAGNLPRGLAEASVGQVGSVLGFGKEGRAAGAATVRRGLDDLRSAAAAAPAEALLVMEEAGLWAAARDGLALCARLAAPMAGWSDGIGRSFAVRGGFAVAAFAHRPPACARPGVVCSGEPFGPGVIGVSDSIRPAVAAAMIREALQNGAEAWADGGPSRYAAAMGAVLAARPDAIRECETCGAPQIARLASPRARYCSDSCRAQGRRSRQRAEQAAAGKGARHELAVS